VSRVVSYSFDGVVLARTPIADDFHVTDEWLATFRAKCRRETRARRREIRRETLEQEEKARDVNRRRWERKQPGPPRPPGPTDAERLAAARAASAQRIRRELALWYQYELGGFSLYKVGRTVGLSPERIRQKIARIRERTRRRYGLTWEPKPKRPYLAVRCG